MVEWVYKNIFSFLFSQISSIFSFLLQKLKLFNLLDYFLVLGWLHYRNHLRLSTSLSSYFIFMCLRFHNLLDNFLRDCFTDLWLKKIMTLMILRLLLVILGLDFLFISMTWYLGQSKWRVFLHFLWLLKQ